MTRKEEIIAEAKKHEYDWGIDVDRFDVPDIFAKGAEWADKTMIKKAWDWFYNMALDYVSGDITDVKWESMFADFRKYVENGDN